ANGNFDQQLDTHRTDEIGLLVATFRDMTDTINCVLQELHRIIQQTQAGHLKFRGNAAIFEGKWRDLVVGINQVIEVFVTPINATTGYIERFSKSDIPEEITTEYKGDFNTIKENLNLLGGDIRNVLTETTTLSQAIQAGKLDARCNPDAFGGGWRELALGINTLVDAFVTPITVTAAYLDRIAKGDIPDTITEEYQGDFNEIKQNMNRLIEAMHGITGLAEAMAGGNLNVEVEERSERD
ncbi:MAG: HAMP domain-containing protein, partial [bacterium]|nr:HAMP domain-containing protein [bacterium]